MSAEDLTIRLGLTGQQQVSSGFERLAAGEKKVGEQATVTGEKARVLGAQLESVGNKGRVAGAKLAGAIDGAHLGLGNLRYGLYGATAGIVGMAAAGAKWGLSFDSQVEQARQRFKLFTTDVDGLTRSVSAIDRSSQFNFGDLSDIAAELGNNGVKAAQIPQILQGIANAAAASGRGTQGLQSIGLAISQIAAKGRLAGDEVMQLNEAGAPGVQSTIQRQFNLTAKQLSNLAGAGIDSNAAINALTRTWTTGAMAKAASDQLKTLGGQWDFFTGNAQKLAGLATEGLAKGLERDVLPAANRAVDQITEIFGEKGLSNQQKLDRARKVIETQLGPTWDHLKDQIDRADIPQHLGDMIGSALPTVAASAGTLGEHAAGAFVTAWLHSGPWAQFLSAAYLAKKLGAFGLVGKALSGGGKGGAGGDTAGALLSRGATPADPLYVWQVGSGLDNIPGVGPNKRAEKEAESGIKPWLRRATSFAKTGIPEGAAIAAPEVAGATAGLAIAAGAGYATGRGIGALGQRIINPSNEAAMHGLLPMPNQRSTGNFATRTIQAPNPQFAANPFVANPLTVNMIVNDQVVAKANVTANAKQKARTR